MSRRRFLATSGAAIGAAALGLAGCGSNHPPNGLTTPAPSSAPDGAAFLDRPEFDGVVRWRGGENLVLENVRFTDRPYTGSPNNDHVCILLIDCKDVVIRNVDFDTVAQPLVFGRNCENITVEWCRVRNITGPSKRLGVHTGNFVQTVGSPANINITDNLIIGGETEDIISFFTTVGGLCARNKIDGSGWVSSSGTGIILGDGGGSGIVVEDNTLLNPGQVGIAIAGGQDHVVRNNVVYQVSQAGRSAWFDGDGDAVAAGAADATEKPIGSNVGMYSRNFYPEYPFGGSVVHGNRVRFWSDEEGSWNGFWDGDDPASVTEFDNEWNDETIDPAGLIVDISDWVT